MVNKSGTVSGLGGVAMAKKQSFSERGYCQLFTFSAIATNDLNHVRLQHFLNKSIFHIL